MFKTFPEFSKLTLADREEYESYIKNFPPMSGISFAKLMLWWNSLNSLAVSVIDGNIVISYWWPGEEVKSGLSLLGFNNIDNSICLVLDYLKDKHEQPRLVHVPEFVVGNIQYPELFSFRGERDLDEYIIPIANLNKPEDISDHRRVRSVKKFLPLLKTKEITVESLDMSDLKNCILLLDASKRWHKKGSVNDTLRHAPDAVATAILHATAIGMKNVCMFKDDRLCGFALYQRPSDKQYIIGNFIKVDHTIPGLFDFMEYIVGDWAEREGIAYLNADCDLGLPALRLRLMRLRPNNFFRKYTIEPS